MADTAIVILLGQSLNTWRGASRSLETGDASARQLVGGGTTQEMDYIATNDMFFMDWNEGASLATQAETASAQSPISGIATTLADAGYTRIYLGGTAIGATGITDLRSRGPIVNIYAMLQRFVSLAAAQGDTDPNVYFYMAHGEYDAENDLAANYQADLTSFAQRCQLAAAQAIGDPTWVSPFIISIPAQNRYPTNGSDATRDIAIKASIRDFADSGDVENVLGPFSIYQWDIDPADFVHPEEDAYVLRGEYVGKIIADYIAGTTYRPLRITSVTRSGTTVTVQFTHNIVKDVTELGAEVGANLAGTEGFEYFDNGSAIAINSVTVSGDTATLVLASAPSGTDEQQVLHHGLQVNDTSGTTWPDDMSGTNIRKDMTPWASSFDATYDNYDWAIQEAASGLPYSYTPPSSGGGSASAPAATVENSKIFAVDQILGVDTYGSKSRSTIEFRLGTVVRGRLNNSLIYVYANEDIASGTGVELGASFTASASAGGELTALYAISSGDYGWVAAGDITLNS